MGTILGDMFKKVGGGLGKVFDGEIIDGVGDVLGGVFKAGGRAVNGALNLVGLGEDDGEPQVRDAWKKKMAAFHPDRIQGKDLAPEWLELAHQKSAEINQAYETIKASRQ